jgi:AcrR family transcriptional regulator
MTAVVTNRHELRRRATRDALREASLRMFAERGFDDVTVTEIAESVGVTERTFYRHFPTKEAVLFHDYSLRLEWLAAALAVRPATEALFDSVLAAARSFPDDLELVRQIALLRSNLISGEQAAAYLREVQGGFADVFQDHVRARHAGHRDVELFSIVAGNVLAGAMVAAVDAWGRGGCVEDVDGMVQRAVAFVREGLTFQA